MQKNIKTRALYAFIAFLMCSSLSAQSYVDFSLQQILSPDSVLFCANNREVAVKVIVKLLDGPTVDSFRLSYQLDNRTTVTEVVRKRIARNDTLHYTFLRQIGRAHV